MKILLHMVMKMMRDIFVFMLSSVGRIEDFVYHMEYGRTSNSWFNNPYIGKTET